MSNTHPINGWLLIRQSSHGFTAGQPLASVGDSFVLAQAITTSLACIFGVVAEVIDAGSFWLAVEGQNCVISTPTPGPDTVPITKLYLSPTTAGAYVNSAPVSPSLSVLALSISTVVTPGLSNATVVCKCGQLDIPDGAMSMTPARLRTQHAAAPGARVSFIFDDCGATDVSILLPVFQARSKVAASAVITGESGPNPQGTTIGTALTLYNAGWEMLNHTPTHRYVVTNSLTEAQIEHDYKHGFDRLEELGLGSSKVLVMPGGEHTYLSRSIARKYASCAFAVGTDYTTAARNIPPLATYSLGRSGLDGATTLAQWKAKVDAAILAGEWLVFYGHSAFAEWAVPQRALDLGALLDYIIAANIPILTPSAALAQVGNLVDVGDYTPQSPDTGITASASGRYFIVGCNGVVANSSDNCIINNFWLNTSAGASALPAATGSGSNSTHIVDRSTTLTTGATANSTASLRSPNGYGVPWQPVAWAVLNWSQPVQVDFFFALYNNTDATNHIFRYVFGRAIGDAVGPLLRKGIGITCKGAEIYLAVHNGTSQTEVRLSGYAGSGAGQIGQFGHRKISVYSDGRGNVEARSVDGQLLAYTSAGPTGNSATEEYVLGAEVSNGATTGSVTARLYPATVRCW